MLAKLFTAAQIKEIDRRTIERHFARSADLMEQAVQRLLPFVEKELSPGMRITVVAGVGNNGGDGLVLARLLAGLFYHVEVIYVPFSSRFSEDFRLNLERLQQMGVNIREYEGTGTTWQADVTVDALFGVGLNRPAKDLAATAIRSINRHPSRVLSIDMPSGLYADRANNPDDPIVEAARVFTFQFPKISFFFDENIRYVPVWQTVDIGLDPEVMAAMPTDKFYLTDGHDLLPQRQPAAGKWAYGHAVLIGGSAGKSGAVRFAAQAALRMGAGWTSVYAPRITTDALRICCPEIMLMSSGDEEILTRFPAQERYTFGTGPGLGTDGETCRALYRWLKTLTKPIVLDADALNCLAQHPESLSHLPPGSILTPHRREWERLTGEDGHTELRLNRALDFSKRYRTVTVLKAHRTAIVHDNKIYFNTTGNAALAKAGTGDVLTGMITGLLTQGKSPLEAALGGVYWHGYMADRWAEKHNNFSLTPQDLIQYLKNIR